jgi:signal transduction histidine kinase
MGDDKGAEAPWRNAPSTWVAPGIFAVLFILSFSSHTYQPTAIEVAIWIVLVAAVELVSMQLPSGTTFSMGFAVGFAVAIIYRSEPWIPMLISAVGGFDSRSFRGNIILSRELYNRAQLGVSTGIAAIALDAVWGSSLARQGFAVLLAALAQLTVQIVSVCFAIRVNAGTRSRDLLPKVLPRPVSGFALVSAGLVLFGTAIATIYLRLGHSVSLVMVILTPLALARFALISLERQSRLRDSLRDQRQLLLQATEAALLEREQERTRIAEQIHHSSLQHLAGAALCVRQARDQVGFEPQQAVVDTLQRADDGLHHVIEELRDTLTDLLDSGMDGGLADSVQAFLKDLRTIWNVQVHCDCSLRREPPPALGLAAFHIVREAASNAAKHSGSAAIIVAVRETDAGIEISVEDEGEGLSAEPRDGERHFGLELMRRRARQAGGELRIQTSPNKGTSVSAFIPMPTQL